MFVESEFPPKPPFSLYEICQLNVIGQVLESSINIQQQHGSYEEEVSQEVAGRVQVYLLSYLPGHLLDELCDGLRVPVQNKAHEWDNRTILAIYMHPYMRKLSVKFRLPCDDSFWLKKLPKLGGLHTLDLKMVCTDEILEVVGKYCPLLEVVNIVSKSESNEVISERPSTIFNALKLKFFVSDEGLRHICQCKHLRTIIMNKTLRSQCGGRMMTNDGIKELLISLPKLEYINYSDIGSILGAGLGLIKRLALTHINDYHPHPNHINTFSWLCPDLQHLCLAVPIDSTVNSNLELGNEIIKQLVNSDLRVSVLELTYFPRIHFFGEFLPSKGKYLTNLSMWNAQPIGSNELLVIGQHCPNILKLHLNELVSDLSDLQKGSAQKLNLFKTLKCLSLTGRKWNSDVILPLCLAHALHLSNLHLLNAGCTDHMDDAIQTVLRSNPLSELESCLFFSGCLLSYSSIEALVKSCSKIRRFSIWQNSQSISEELEGLIAEQRKRYIDINIISIPL